jgi:nuclear pore complex protein Nup160
VDEIVHTVFLHMVLRRYKENVLNKPTNELGAAPLELTVPLPDVNTGYGRFEVDEHENEDVEDSYYLDHVASTGSIALLNQSPRAICYRLLRNGRVLELEPADVSSNEANRKFRKIRLSSPLKIRQNCVSLSEDSDTRQVVLDFITVNGFFYTIAFGPNEFLANYSTKLSNSNGPSWRSIKSPYSFDVKKPLAIQAASSKLVLISICDGTVVRLDRDEPLGVVTTNFMQDTGSGLSFSKLLPWNQGGKVPGKPDLSVRAIMSLVSSDSLIAAMTINNTLKVWSKETGSLVGEYDLGKDTKSLLDPHPARLLAFTDDGKFLLSYSPNEETGKFTLWRVDNNGKGLENLGEDFEVDATAPDNTAVWLLGDLRIQTAEKGLNIWALWKSDMSSSVHSYLLPFDSKFSKQSLWHVSDSGIEPQSEFVRKSDTTSEDESEYFLRKVFGPNGFSLETIRTALPIYGKHYGLQSFRPELNSQELEALDVVGLRDQVCKTVGSAVSVENSTDGLTSDFKAYKNDLGLQWVRFSRLCSELEKQGKESLSMAFDEKTNTLYVVKASFISVIRNSTDIELYYNNKSTAPSKGVVQAISDITKKKPDMVENTLRLLDALYQFRLCLSHYILYDIFVALEEDFSLPHLFLTEEREINIYETVIESHITDHALGTLVTALFEIPELDQVVLELYNVLMATSAATEQYDGKLTSYGSQLLSNGLFEFAYTARSLVIDVLIVTLISSCQDDLIGEHTTIYAKFSSLLKCLCSSLDLVFMVPEKSRESSLNDSYNNMVEQVDKLSVRQQENHYLAVSGLSFVESLIEDTHMSSPLQIWAKFNERLNPAAHAEIAVELFTRGYQDQVMEYMNQYMPHDSFSTFIRGNVLLGSGDKGKNAETLIRKAAIGISENGLSEREVKIAIRLNNLYNEGESIKSLWKYFYAVSAVAASFDKSSEALEFIKLAERNASPCSDEEELQIYAALFDRAIKALAYDDAYTAITEVAMISNDKVATMVDRLVSTMVQNGRGDRLCHYPFIGISDKVTELLEQKTRNFMNGAEDNEPNLLIPYYKVLYGWYIERGNFREGELIILLLINRLLTVFSCRVVILATPTYKEHFT